jgi:L-seryl-tRNA(Ser) seleniumtransferase
MSTMGGGSAPGSRLPTWLVTLAHEAITAAQIEERLRLSEPPVIARIERDRVTLDLRTVSADDDEKLYEAVVRALDR